MLFAENLGGKGMQTGTFLPCIDGQARFAAGLLEKGDAIPLMLNRNLRQQQAAAAVLSDQQAVTADFDLLGKNRLRRRENA